MATPESTLGQTKTKLDTDLTSNNIDYKLRPFQLKIVEECWNKGSGGLSLPMGSGKTRIALMLSDGLTLVVCTKSEITTWVEEMQKCGYEKYQYQILHKEYVKKPELWFPRAGTKVIVTTIQTLNKVYTSRNLKKKVVKSVCPYFGAPVVKYYYPATEPLVNVDEGPGWLFSHTLGTLIVDEAQAYLNIQTQGCQALLCIQAKQRWLLSGTLFDEPVPKRILGYTCLLRVPGVPRSVVDIGSYIRGTPLKYNYTNIKIVPFLGLWSTMVYRKKNEMYTPPKIHAYVIANSMTVDERKIYTALRSVFIKFSLKADALKAAGATIEARKCRSSMLAMLTYLRMSLVSPLLPMTGVYIDMMDSTAKSDLAKTLLVEIKELKLDKWLADEQSAYTSRIRKVCQEANKYTKERIVIFTCFRKSLDMIKYYLSEGNEKELKKSALSNLPNSNLPKTELRGTSLPKTELRGTSLPKMELREVMTISGNMSITQRGKVIDNFRNSTNGILLLTYATGGNGLNLQCSNTVFITEFWWNAGKSDQGIARVNRFGQKADIVNIAYFTSNTAIEKGIFHKHDDKQKVYQDLLYGTQKNKIARLSMKEILKFVQMEENEDLLCNIHLKSTNSSS